MKTLTTARHKLQGIRSLNWGGCGVSALAMYLVDKARGEAGCFALCFDVRYRHEHESNVRAMNGECERNIYAPCHVYYKKKGKYYDSDCIKSKTWLYSHYRCIAECGFDFLVKLIREGRSWNKDFNKERYVPVIERWLDVDLTAIKA